MKKLVCFCAFVIGFWGTSLIAQVSMDLFEDESDGAGDRVTITANSVSYRTEDNRPVFTGNVMVTTTDIILKSDEAIIQFVDNTNDLETLEMTGNVSAENDGEGTLVSAQWAHYNQIDGTLRMEGEIEYIGPRLRAKGDVYTYDTGTGDSTFQSVTGSVEGG